MDAKQELMAIVADTLRTWFEADVEYVALSNGLPAETFKADDPPCRLDSARARGLEVLHLNRDMQRLAEAIIYAATHVLDDTLATLEAEAGSPLPIIRGKA